MWEDTLLLDGKTSVATDQLVSNMLKAALLALEQSGVIRLEFEQRPGGGKSNALMVVPTGGTKEWPPATLEARLLVNKRATVSDVVFDWLGEDSNDPWHRAAEQGKIMLVLRGIAEVSLSKWGSRKYGLAKDASAVASQTSAQPVVDLLAECREKRSEVWKSLDQEIKEAVDKRRSRSTNENASDRPDPWLAESVTDQKKYAVHPKPKVVSAFVLFPLGLSLALLDWWFAVRQGHGAFALVTAMIVTVLLGIFSLPLQSTREFQKRITSWMYGRIRIPLDVPDPSLFTLKERLSGAVFGVSALTGIALICRTYVQAGLLIAIGGWGAYRLYPVLHRLLASKAASAINTLVTGKGVVVEAQVSTDSTRVNAVHEGSSSTEPIAKQPAPDLPFTLELFTTEALPPASYESSLRLEAIGRRGPAVRASYRKGILFLAAATVLLAILYWVIGPSPFNFTSPSDPQSWQMPQRMPVFFFIFFLITLVMVSRRGSALLRGAILSSVLSIVTGGRVSSPPIDLDETTASIRPIGLPFLGGVWLMVILIAVPTRYASIKGPIGVLFTAASLAVAFGYLYWIWKTTKTVERQYPFQPPFNLLALRVFGSPHLSDFLDLTNAWQWIGTRQMLDGPDTVGYKARDLINYFSGRPNDSVVENAAELQDALRDFKIRPDLQLRFPVNSMQCNDASWKTALQSLLDTADVVVMDLSSLSEKNRGIAYELGKVLDQIALSRIVLLVDDSTDLAVLKDILARTWENMAQDSPNRLVTDDTLRVYHVGGPLKHMPGESLYDWRRRLASQIDEKHLVCLLYDAAQPRRTPVTVDPRRDLQSVRWSRVPMPHWVRLVRNVAFAMLLSFVVVISSCHVMTSG